MGDQVRLEILWLSLSWNHFIHFLRLMALGALVPRLMNEIKILF